MTNMPHHPLHATHVDAGLLVIDLLHLVVVKFCFVILLRRPSEAPVGFEIGGPGARICFPLPSFVGCVIDGGRTPRRSWSARASGMTLFSTVCLYFLTYKALPRGHIQCRSSAKLSAHQELSPNSQAIVKILMRSAMGFCRGADSWMPY